MKRTLLALLVGLSLLLSLAACGSERASAQEVTEQGLAALRDLDVLALPQYWNTDGLNLDDLGDLTQAGEEVDLSAEDTAALAQAMTRHLSWQVISAQEDPGAGTASVTVSLTNLDMAPVVGQFLQEAFSDALSSALQADGQQPTEEEMTQQYLQTLTDLLNQEGLDTRTTTVEVPLTLVDGQWKITPDEAVVDAYAADPMCRFVPTVGMFHDMMGGLQYIWKTENLNKMDKSTPVYFMAGDGDPVGNYGEAVKKVYERFLKTGCKDVKLKLYKDGRHEMLNELNKDEVYADVLEWLNSKI